MFYALTIAALIFLFIRTLRLSSSVKQSTAQLRLLQATVKRLEGRAGQEAVSVQEDRPEHAVQSGDGVDAAAGQETTPEPPAETPVQTQEPARQETAAEKRSRRLIGAMLPPDEAKNLQAARAAADAEAAISQAAGKAADDAANSPEATDSHENGVSEAAEEPIAAHDAAGDAETVQPAPPPPAPAPPPVAMEPLRRPVLKSLEEKLAAHWLVWLGGIAVALSGLFLVKYAAERGWFSPGLRMVMGLAVGAALTMAGEWVRRRPQQTKFAAIRPDYVPQAVTAAGLFIAFASTYVSYAFYDVVAPITAFILLAFIAVGAFGLSLLQGPFVAALGLLGALITPALVSTGSPTVWGLFGYLLAITAAVGGVERYRAWPWLSLSAVAGNMAWLALWFGYEYTPGDFWPLAGFLLASTAVFATLTRWSATAEDQSRADTADSLSALGPALTAMIAVAGALFWFVVFLSYTAHENSHLMALTGVVALAALAARALPRLPILYPAAAATAFFGMASWAPRIADTHDLWRRFIDKTAPLDIAFVPDHVRYPVFCALLAVIVFAAGLWLLRHSRPQREGWMNTISCLLLPILILGLAYLRYGDVTADGYWTAAAALYATACWFGARFLRSSSGAADGAWAIPAFDTAQIAGVSLALALFFTGLPLTLALTLQLGAYCWLQRDATAWHTRKLLLVLATVIVVRLTLNANVLDYELTAVLGQHWVLYGFAGPALVFWLAAQWLRIKQDDELVVALECGALAFAILLVSYEIRVLIAGSLTAPDYSLLEASVQTISWLTGAYGLMHRNAATPRAYSQWGAWVLAGLAVGQIALVHLFAENPAIYGAPIGGFPLVNELTLAYLVPGVLLWFAATRLGDVKLGQLELPGKLIACALVAIYATLELRFWFQGDVIGLRHASLLELYTTTLLWLALACAVFATRRLRADEAMHRFALGLLGIVVLTLVAGHVLAYNPAVTGEWLSGTLIFNPMLLGFIVPAVVFVWLARNSEKFDLAAYRDVLGGLAYALGLVFVTLEVRHAFHGPDLLHGAISDAEYYGYSAVWLVYALVTLAVGIWLTRPVIRYAALGVLLLAVLKVFLFDMAGLAGLWRIISFMGLGVSLIGIGYIYQRYVFPLDGKPQDGADQPDETAAQGQGEAT